MIYLDVEKYCHECPKFEAVSSGNIVSDSFDRPIVNDHIVSCVYKRNCAAIRNYLEKENKNA